MPLAIATQSAQIRKIAYHSWTYSVDGINFLSPLILLPLDPMLIQVIEQLIDISRSIRISLPLLRIVL